MKICTRCNVEKTEDLFATDKRARDNLTSWCRVCKTEGSLQWKRDNPSKVRQWKLKSKYGMNNSDYTAMLLSQNGVCAICGKKETRTQGAMIQFLSIDHCHKTGKVRGLLCHNCNTMIGQAKDKIQVLENAITYLRKNENGRERSR